MPISYLDLLFRSMSAVGSAAGTLGAASRRCEPRERVEVVSAVPEMAVAMEGRRRRMRGDGRLRNFILIM